MRYVLSLIVVSMLTVSVFAEGGNGSVNMGSGGSNSGSSGYGRTAKEKAIAYDQYKLEDDVIMIPAQYNDMVNAMHRADHTVHALSWGHDGATIFIRHEGLGFVTPAGDLKWQAPIAFEAGEFKGEYAKPVTDNGWIGFSAKSAKSNLVVEGYAKSKDQLMKILSALKTEAKPEVKPALSEAELQQLKKAISEMSPEEHQKFEELVMHGSTTPTTKPSDVKVEVEVKTTTKPSK